MATGAMTVLLLTGLAAVALCAPAPVPSPAPVPAPVPAPALKESPSNQVIVDDDAYLSQDERERVVAGIILQIARDFDEGFITLDDLEGRSSVRQDDVARKGKDESALSKDKSPQTPPVPPSQTRPLAT